MKINLLIIFLAGISSGLVGCFSNGIDLCPTDISLGRLRLTQPTFSPYQGTEVLTFSNRSGRQLVLTNFDYATLSTEQRLIVSTPCFKNDWNKQELYYESPRLFISYRLSKNDYVNTLNYSFGIQDLRTNQALSDTILAEDLMISNNFIRPNSVLRILVSDRGNRSRFDPVNGQYPRLIQYRLIEDTLLNGRSYKQVYCNQEAPTLFFTKTKGIVAFKDEREWWYLAP